MIVNKICKLFSRGQKVQVAERKTVEPAIRPGLYSSFEARRAAAVARLEEVFGPRHDPSVAEDPQIEVKVVIQVAAEIFALSAKRFLAVCQQKEAAEGAFSLGLCLGSSPSRGKLPELIRDREPDKMRAQGRRDEIHRNVSPFVFYQALVARTGEKLDRLTRATDEESALNALVDLFLVRKAVSEFYNRKARRLPNLHFRPKGPLSDEEKKLESFDQVWEYLTTSPWGAAWEAYAVYPKEESEPGLTASQMLSQPPGSPASTQLKGAERTPKELAERRATRNNWLFTGLHKSAETISKYRPVHKEWPLSGLAKLPQREQPRKQVRTKYVSVSNGTIFYLDRYFGGLLAKAEQGAPPADGEGIGLNQHEIEPGMPDDKRKKVFTEASSTPIRLKQPDEILRFLEQKHENYREGRAVITSAPFGKMKLIAPEKIRSMNPEIKYAYLKSIFGESAARTGVIGLAPVMPPSGGAETDNGPVDASFVLRGIVRECEVEALVVRTVALVTGLRSDEVADKIAIEFGRNDGPDVRTVKVRGIGRAALDKLSEKLSPDGDGQPAMFVGFDYTSYLAPFNMIFARIREAGDLQRISWLPAPFFINTININSFDYLQIVPSDQAGR